MRKATWHIMSSKDESYIKEVALSMGWLDNKVQVRRVYTMGTTRWLIEPYEEQCRCPDIIKPPHNKPEEKINT